MAYLCVTCVPFNSQYKCFSTLNSTAWVSLMKVKQRLSALLITQPNDCSSTRSPRCNAVAPRIQPKAVCFGLIEPGHKSHPDSQNFSASSVPQYFFPFPGTSCVVLNSVASPPCLSAPASWESVWLYTPANMILWDKTSPGAPKMALKWQQLSLTWGSVHAWQRHGISLVRSNSSKSSEIKILGIAARVKLF